jgi:hypothetical protein
MGELKGGFYFSHLHPVFILEHGTSLEEVNLFEIECKKSKKNHVNEMYGIEGLRYTGEARVICKVERKDVQPIEISDFPETEKLHLCQAIVDWNEMLKNQPEKSFTEITDILWSKRANNPRIRSDENDTERYNIILTDKGRNIRNPWKNKLLKVYLKPGEKCPTSLHFGIFPPGNQDSFWNKENRFFSLNDIYSEYLLDHLYEQPKYIQCNFHKEKGFDNMAMNVYSENQTKMLLALIGDDLKEISAMNFEKLDTFTTDNDTLENIAWDAAYSYNKKTNTLFINRENFKRNLAQLVFILKQIQMVARLALDKKWIFAIMGY